MKSLYFALLHDLREVREAIIMYRDGLGVEWADHCQTLLRANSGWNAHEFWQFCEFNAQRLTHLLDNEADEFQRWWHRFGIEQIEIVMLDLIGSNIDGGILSGHSDFDSMFDTVEWKLIKQEQSEWLNNLVSDKSILSELRKTRN